MTRKAEKMDSHEILYPGVIFRSFVDVFRQFFKFLC